MTEISKTEAAEILSEKLAELSAVYVEAIQGPLFGVLITLAGLLLAAHNVLVVNLHRDLYDDPEFRDFARRVEPKKNPMARLTAFSRQMRFCIVVCFAGSISQFTVGFLPGDFAAVFCIGIAVVAAAFMVRVFVTQNQAIGAWLGYLTTKASKEDELRKKAAHASSLQGKDAA